MLLILLPAMIQTAWKDLLQHYSPKTIVFFGTLLVQLISFWAVCAIYISLPYLFPSFSARHKLQKQEKQPTIMEIRECCGVVLRNQLVSFSVQLAIIALRPAKPPLYRCDLTLPGPAEVIRDITLGMIIREILFYYIHRLFHHPSIYPVIHKPHHRFTAPVALSAQYASVAEHLLANVMPIVLPPVILNSHIVTFFLFMALELAKSAAVHSGYDFLAASARNHDLHHEKFVVNFGLIGLLDWLHKTDGRNRADGKAKTQ